MSVAEQLFKVSLHLAKFLDINVLEIRKIEVNEIIYLYNSLVSYDFEDIKETYQNAGKAKPRKRFADEVDWFN